MPQISIYYCPEEGAEVMVIPVSYEVDQRDEFALKIMHCTVALPECEIPSWLHPRLFDLIAHRGYVSTSLEHPSAEAWLSIPDADSFRYKVYGKILSTESEAENSDSLY